MDSSIDSKVKIAILTEIRDSIEIVHSQEYVAFLTNIMPSFLHLLEVTPPSLILESVEHKLRNMILEIIHRFPYNEMLKDYAKKLMASLMALLHVDNEENGVICLKIIVDLHKNYTALMDDQVQTFLDLVRETYLNMPNAVANAFGPNAAPQKVSTLSKFSFRVLTECPIIIALLFQLYRNYVTPNVPSFIEPIIMVLTLQPPQQQQAHDEAASKGTIFLGMAPSIQNPIVYAEFKSLQVKTVSFLAYILRSFIAMLKPFQDQIADGVITVMKDLPGDASATRKELLVAARHLWFTDFRVAFLRHINVLLTDDVLVGTGVTCQETLRPLAHSVLIDLLHNVRIQLTLPQISRIIIAYSKTLQDINIPPQIQTMCVKLLLGLADNLVNQPSKTEARQLLIQILDSFACRLTVMHDMFPTVLKYHERKKASSAKNGEENFVDLQEIEGFVDIGTVQPIRTTIKSMEGSPEILKDMRFQFKSVLIGVKSCLQALRSIDNGARPSTRVTLDIESEILNRVFLRGLDCFEYYFVDVDKDKLAVQKDDKEAIEAFASIFTVIDPCLFQEVCAENISYLFDKALANHFIVSVPQYFLCNVVTSANFSGPLLSYLMGKFEDIGKADSQESIIILRLFKLLFLALGMFPDQNEKVFQPHLSKLIMSSLKLSSNAEEPVSYFLLLRGLFRSIGGGKFELLYQEVIPLLQVLLESLNGLLASAHKPQMRELFVELALTVPVRLSVLLPHLSYLMRPLVIALQAGSDLAHQSLKTLELCIDNLNHEFLEPIFAPVKSDLMAALWRHLHPSPYNQNLSHSTMRILGKFGGRNRRLVGENLPLDLDTSCDDDLQLSFFMHGNAQLQNLPLGKALMCANDLLVCTTSKQPQLDQAFEFLKACAPLFFDADTDVENLENAVHSLVEIFKKKVAEKGAAQSKEESPFQDEPILSKHRRLAIDNMISKWVLSLIEAAAIPSLEENATALLHGLCRHFALLDIDEFVNSRPSNDPNSQHVVNDVLIETASSRLNGFLRALVDGASNEKPSTRKVAENTIEFLKSSYMELLGSDTLVESVTAFQILPLLFASQCYQSEWFKKQGGCHGISIMISSLKFSQNWLLGHEIEFVKALLYLLKGSTVEAAQIVKPSPSETFQNLLQSCNEGGQMDDEAYSAKFSSLVSVLITELSNSSGAVRSAIQKGLDTLSQLNGRPVSEFLMPARDRLLYPIFAKPLRALPFTIQIGYIDAITYGLSLRPPLVQFNDELGRLIHEALALADAEDQALSGKDNQYKNATAMNNLRVECIKLLSAVMASPDIMAPKYSNVKQRIITLFFKCLYSKSPEVVAVANVGLTDVLSQQQRLPKDLLQAGLKPILVNVSDYKKLTVAGLQGLSRLLELLTNYFKVEIGRKLLDHLRQWAEPVKMEEWSLRPLSAIDDISIISAILDVFYLLPAAANIFLEELIMQVIELEAMIHRSSSSPFRKPLCRFLNRYASESVDFFLSRLGNNQFASLFIGVLKIDIAEPLLNEVLSNPDKIEKAIFGLDPTAMNSEEGQLICQNGVNLIFTLSTLKPSWLKPNRTLFDACVALWRNPQTTRFIDQFAKNRQTLSILSMMIIYCDEDPSEVDLLFDILDGFLDPTLTDLNFLKQFIFKLASTKDTATQKQILKRFLELYSQDSFTLRRKANIIRHLIVPLLMLLKGDYATFIDQECIHSILIQIWNPPVQGGTASEIDGLKMELLQLTTLLLYLVPEYVGDYLKEVIKYAWGHLKLEDVTIKQSGSVLMCRFIKEYDTPTKIVAQTYVAQLKAHQTEIRPMVRQALDNIIPVLPFRPGMSREEGNIPVWIQWIRKIIIEDGHSVSQLVSIYQLLIRNSANFFHAREHFLPQIVSSLARLGLSGNATAETKSLSIDLTHLISKWENQYMQDKKNDDAMQVDGNEKFTTSDNQKEVIITFLIRFCLSLTLTDPVLHKSLFTKALDTLENFISLWPDGKMTLQQFEKVAAMDINEHTMVLVLNAAEILKVLVRAKPLSWVQKNIGLIQKCLERWGGFNPASLMVNNSPANSVNGVLLSCFSEIIPRVIEALDYNDSSESPRRSLEKQAFFKSLDSKIHEKLRTESNIDMITCFLKVAYLEKISDPVASQSLRPHLADLVKLLQKVVEDASPTDFQQGSLNDSVRILILILNSQILYLGELRKSFLAILGKIADRKEAGVLQKNILEIIRKWIFDPTNEGFPTIKEKSNLAARLSILKNHGDVELYENYMSFVAEVYESGHLARTEITVRLEKVFLEGLRLSNRDLRARFANLLDQSIPNSMPTRLSYIFGQQNWQGLSDSYWIQQALDLLLGSINVETKVYDSNADMRFPFLNTQNLQNTKPRKKNAALKSYLVKETEFLSLLKTVTVESIVNPIRNFIHEDGGPVFSHVLWSKFFPLCWDNLNSNGKHDLVKSLIMLLAKDFHLAQASARPNVVQTILDGACRAEPCIQLPPQLLKYLGKTFNCWHTSLELLQKSISDLSLASVGASKEDDMIRDSFMDALGDLYTDLGEDDYFSGLWRRRCLFSETNTAVSFEQIGLWQPAQKFYEDAQTKARTCALPFTESEYYLWEKQWISCTQKLQQWDILTDLSKHDSNPDLLLECAWRLSDWNTDRDALNMTLQSVSQPFSARKKFFQGVLVLNRISEGQEPASEFHKICEDGMQLLLKQWHGLPKIISNSHISTFHSFQLFVELQEAFSIQSNLIGTNATNIDTKSQELKNILSTWRDRLPNTWDDMNIWSDLVSWRQHVFTSINKSYLPLIPQIISPASGNNASSSYAYRGYHETAWIINRFASVARKHQLPEVCISSLGKIYTLPNIEIQEAFFKLREQAKCHKDVLKEHAAGLDVINNTNLVFFSPSQKADFFTLKGEFFATLNIHDEAVQAFSSAIQIDTNLGQAWAKFGEYNDRMFDERPQELKFAADAVNCYLNAAGIFNSGRSRKYLSRILWLLSLDDDKGTVMASAEAYKPDAPVWYWISFIPELIASLAGKEAKFGRNILIKIAKSYPQALHFQLRTTKEDFATMKRNAQPPATSQEPAQPIPIIIETPAKESTDVEMSSADEQPEALATATGGDTEMTGSKEAPEKSDSSNAAPSPPAPWEHIEEIMAILKTAYPLLALTMETVVDQLLARLKPSADEDIFRLIVALLNDGIQMYLTHLPKYPEDGGPLSQATESSLNRFAESMTPNHVQYREAFERDFISSKPNMSQLVERFRIWRDKLEILLDARPQRHNLEYCTSYLAEFEHFKFDDVEVPGQYLQMKSSSKDFARIERFDPIVGVARTHAGCYRRITIIGHDGTRHPFLIQHPAAKQCRREERTQQLFRFLNETLERKIETRRRNLHFHVPAIVPLGPQIRLIRDDQSNVTLQEIFEDHARKNGFGKDDPLVYYADRYKEACLAQDLTQKSKVDIIGLKAEINQEIAEKMIPETIVSKFFWNKMDSFQDLWTLRKRFTGQMATVTFMSYLLSIGNRTPQKFSISCEKGNIWFTELFPNFSPQTFLLSSHEAVPFRLTPNLQHFMTPVGVEGHFCSSILSLATAFLETDLQDYLSIFLRDELVAWQAIVRKPLVNNTEKLRELVDQNRRLAMHRVQVLSCKAEKEAAMEDKPVGDAKIKPVNQSILDLISQATNPLKLAQMDAAYMSQL